MSSWHGLDPGHFKIQRQWYGQLQNNMQLKLSYANTIC